VFQQSDAEVAGVAEQAAPTLTEGSVVGVVDDQAVQSVEWVEF
jgi:hypothetical protein